MPYCPAMRRIHLSDLMLIAIWGSGKWEVGNRWFVATIHLSLFTLNPLSLKLF